MIDERFSSAAFEGCGIDTQPARDLADLLAREIQIEMHEAITAQFGKIVGQLNAMGHALKPEYDPLPGDLSYRDDWRDDSGYHCKLRVGFDSVVSTGFAHLLNADELESE